MQNDVLRFVKNVRIKDMISRVQLHKEARLLSLEQRREKHLLILMYKLSQKGMLRKITHIELPDYSKSMFSKLKLK